MQFLHFLYHTIPGRLLLKPLASRTVSKAAGSFLDSQFSKWLIPVFVRSNRIDMSEYETEGFRCFNDCFSRKIKPGLRPVEENETSMIAPCDGLLSVWPIRDGVVLPVKQSLYTVESLVRDKALAEQYKDGLALVYRLCVDHYHRYAYVESGRKSRDRFIAGKLHTVRPVALYERPVFIENCRAYTTIRTEHFGELVQMEVGAMLVGKIQNACPQEASVRRGEEKGMFLYGGSTIIVLVEKEKLDVDPEIMSASLAGEEYPVRLGQAIGRCHDEQIRDCN